MKKLVTLFLISTLSMNMEAQTKAPSITGEYYLNGVRETASGFNFNEDKSFEFFFSYGALDRTGVGTWEIKDDKVILNSPKPKGYGFILAASKIVENDEITIQIVEENTFFLNHVYAIVVSGDTQQKEMSNQKGIIHFKKLPVDSITLIFEFTGEKKDVFIIPNKENNYFEFKFDPSIMDVIFDNLSLSIDKNVLSGQLPLLVEGIYEFEKK
ncbi:MAG: hypothetical protein ABIT58_09785 [Ferruginibacter sp.]